MKLFYVFDTKNGEDPIEEVDECNDISNEESESCSVVNIEKD